MSEEQELNQNQETQETNQTQEAQEANQTQETNQNQEAKEDHPNTVEYKRLQSEMEQQMSSIAASMERMHFTDEEKKEVFDIIEYHTILKEAAKTPLIKINENAILDQVEDKVKQNIKDVSANMVKCVNDKMKEIINRKYQK